MSGICRRLPKTKLSVRLSPIQCCDYESGCGCPTPTETSQQGRVCSPKMETEAAHQSRKVVSPHPLRSKEEGEELSAAGPPNQLRSSGAPFPLSFLSWLSHLLFSHCLQTSVPQTKSLSALEDSLDLRQGLSVRCSCFFCRCVSQLSLCCCSWDFSKPSWAQLTPI
jgi:hypothetical protein